jgi:gliding motility-associated-like protein
MRLLSLTWALFLCIFLMPDCRAQTWLWGKASGVADQSVLTGGEGFATCSDSSGNVYMTGHFIGHIVFGSFILINTERADCFLAKYDPNGNVIWAKKIGGNGNTFSGTSVCTDVTGNVILAGTYDGSSITIDHITLHSLQPNFNKVFIAKFDANGNVIWAKSTGGVRDHYCGSMSVDLSGNVLITGIFGQIIQFDSIQLSAPLGDNIFLAKYNPNGNAVWATGPHGSGKDWSNTVCSDRSGNVCIAGYIASSQLSFGSIIISNTAVWGSNIFIAKYDSNGNIIWAKSASGTGSDVANSICSDPMGNTYVTGYFRSPKIQFGSILLSKAGMTDFYLAKYDPNGTVIWAKSAGNTGVDFGYTVCTDLLGNVYVSGGFSSPFLNFGPHSIKPPAGSSDPIFIVKYDSLGNNLCASALASGGDDQDAICSDLFGNVYVVGDYVVPKFAIGSDTLVSVQGSENLFIAKFVCGCSSVANIQGPDKTCKGTPLKLVANGGGNYSWSNGANTGDVLIYPDTNTVYSVITSYSGCSDTAYKSIKVFPAPSIELIGQTYDFCEGGHNGSITTSTSSGTLPYSYSWSPTGENLPSINGLGIGTYTLFVKDSNGCSASNVTKITSSTLFVPNYFSPNNDGINDTECVYGNCFTAFSFSIYDRWGEKVFESIDSSICWDGFYKGVLMDSQVFVYNLKVALGTGEIINQKGNISLVR